MCGARSARVTTNSAPKPPSAAAAGKGPFWGPELGLVGTVRAQSQAHEDLDPLVSASIKVQRPLHGPAPQETPLDSRMQGVAS